VEPDTTCVPLEISEGGTWNSFQPDVDLCEDVEIEDPDGWVFEGWDEEIDGGEIVD
jgi:hypothetical protein